MKLGCICGSYNQSFAAGAIDQLRFVARCGDVLKVAGVEFQDYKTLDAGGPLSEDALLSNEIQVSDFFTTQSVIEEKNLVVLEDPKDIILPGNIVPVIRDDVPDRATVEQTLNAVTQALTTEELSQMVAAVDEKKEPMDDVAGQFLQEQGLAG